MDQPVDGQAIRRDVLSAFEYAHNKDAWVFPLAEALAGVTAREAIWKPATAASDLRSIWEIVLHMTVWTENLVQRGEQRMRGEPPGRPPEGDWPPLPATPDEGAWEQSQRRLWDALAGLRAYIETTPPTVLLDQGNAGYSQFADLLCCLIHNAYHIGQITKLRDFYASQGANS